MRLTVVLTATALAVAGCAPRLEPPVPEEIPQVDTVSEWSTGRAEPYGIPERQLRAYAFAAWRVHEDGGCQIGWPTLAAIGQVASDHGRAGGSVVQEDGRTSKPLRGLPIMGKPPVTVRDTDSAVTDDDPGKDVAVGPMQIMPSRWEQYASTPETGREPDPDHIDDAALTAARILCEAGNPTTPEGWDEGVKRFFPDPDAVKAVHHVARELSR
ncbi:hypothetical protein KBX19_09865 [Corynebacterium sp. CCUG 71335]|nr:hypothetical protein [Corynebacterium sp. CCUG 71335]